MDSEGTWEVKSLVRQNVISNGKVYSLHQGEVLKLPETVAKLFRMNKWVDIPGYYDPVEEAIKAQGRVKELWEAKTTDKRLKKYTGDRLICCINTRTKAEAMPVIQRYSDIFDEFALVEGTYRSYGGKWASQIVKRNHYLQEGILVILDTDERISGADNLRDFKGDVGWVWVECKDSGRRYRQPRVFRYIEGIHYLKRHHWIYDGNGDFICSHARKGKYKHVDLDITFTNLGDTKHTEDSLKEYNKYRELLVRTEVVNPEDEKASICVAHFNWQDLAGLSYALSEALNKYTTISSRSFSREITWINYPRDLLISDDTVELLSLAEDSADIIVQNETYEGNILLGKKTNKPMIMIHHGCQYREQEDFYRQKDAELADLVLVTTVDLLKHDPRSLYLPSIVDVDGLNKLRDDKEFAVVHSATVRSRRNTDNILKAIEEIDVPVIMLEMEEHSKSIVKRGKGSVCIDHITGDFAYGVGTLESMSMGQPVIIQMDDYSVKKCEELFGELPVIQVNNLEEMKAEIIKLRDDKDYYDKWSKKSLEYVRKYHSPEHRAKVFEHICNSLIMGKKITQEEIL